MKKSFNIYLICVVILLIIISSIVYIINNKFYNKNAVIVRVEEHGLMAYADGLYSVGFTEKGDIGFKKGQEIQITYDGMILASYPGQFSNVKKIKIVKEESDIEIPEYALKHCYNSIDKIKVDILELTNKGIAFTITDKNEFPYNFSHDYSMRKKIKNTNYNPNITLAPITDNNGNSNYILPSYTGTGPKYIWENIEKISNLSTLDTEEEIVLPDMTGNNQSKVSARKFDWTDLYGELGERRI